MARYNKKVLAIPTEPVAKAGAVELTFETAKEAAAYFHIAINNFYHRVKHQGATPYCGYTFKFLEGEE